MGQAAAAGTSSTPMGRCRRHPVVSSQWVAGATGGGPTGGDSPRRQPSSTQPSKYQADENGSIPPNRASSRSPCRRALLRT